MGWDSIEYGGHHELFRDFDLWTLRHFFIEEAKVMEVAQPGDETTELRNFFEEWDWLGPGVFTGTDFSQYILNSHFRWELVIQFLHQAGDRISCFGELIPLDYLTAHVNTKGAYYTAAQPTRRFLICIGRICTLLGKHEPGEHHEASHRH